MRAVVVHGSSIFHRKKRRKYIDFNRHQTHVVHVRKYIFISSFSFHLVKFQCDWPDWHWQERRNRSISMRLVIISFLVFFVEHIAYSVDAAFSPWPGLGPIEIRTNFIEYFYRFCSSENVVIMCGYAPIITHSYVNFSKAFFDSSSSFVSSGCCGRDWWDTIVMRHSVDAQNVQREIFWERNKIRNRKM